MKIVYHDKQIVTNSKKICKKKLKFVTNKLFLKPL